MSSREAIREQILSAVQYNLGIDAKESGAVLCNGWSTVQEGKLYLMGLNPGGDPGKIEPDVHESINDTFNKFRSDYSAYTDECWIKKHPDDCSLETCKGNSRHQKTVCALISALGLGITIREVFAVNAIFIRSALQLDLRDPWKLWEKCWPVHQLFLSIVQPKLILCLGNGDGLSSFSLLRSKFSNAPIPQNVGLNRFRDGKWFEGKVVISREGQELNCMVLGIPHPSRFGMSKTLERHLKELRPKLLAAGI